MWPSWVGPGLATLGPWGLLITAVATIVFAFITGKLVSGNQVKAIEERNQKELDRITAYGEAERARLVALWEARLIESHTRERDWKVAFERSEQRADVLAGQVDKLMTYAQTADQLLRAIPGGRAA